MFSENPPLILMVDDRPSNLVALEAALGGNGYLLVPAQSGDEAIELVRREDFAVILLDVHLPQRDGFETARLIRDEDRARSTPIIFLTANYPDERYVRQGYEAGAVDYLNKPLSPEVLRAKVAVFVELFRRNRELARRGEQLRDAERRAGEVELAKLRRASERKYRNLVEGIRDGIVWSADLSMRRFTFVSRYAKRITGFSDEVWLQEDGFWEKNLHPDDRERVLAAFARTRATGEGFVLEHRFRKGDGHSVWFHTSVNVEPDGLGEPELCGLSVDVTHLKRTERALRDAIRARDEFLAVASHELRTPITPLHLQMQGFIRRIESGEMAHVTPERLKDMLEISDSQVARLARLITQLLDISRMDTGRFALTLEEVELVSLVRSCIDQLQHDIRSAECVVAVHGDETFRLSVDRPRMEQVVINLVNNALKYGAGKPIDVHVFSREGVACVSVKDRGIGIARSDYARIFERFERAVSARHYGGLGLGLYISAKIVELHQGVMRVQSELGRGSEFTVELPLIPSVRLCEPFPATTDAVFN